MGRNPIETVMGAVVLLVAGLFLVFAYASADLRPVEGYPIQARFSKVGGLKTGADVRISGVKVGTVTSEKLDPATFHAIVGLTIMPSVRLPVDSRAVISTDGLLGGAYVRLEPGRSSQVLKDGEALRKIQDYQSMEDMVSEMIFLVTKDPNAGSNKGKPAPSPDAPE